MSLPVSHDSRLLGERYETDAVPLETLEPIEKVPPRPFALWGILITGVFFPIIIPIMVAVNWRRLGKPRRTIPTLVFGFLGFMVTPILSYFFAFVLMGFEAYVSDAVGWVILALFPSIALLLLYIGLIRWQSSAYRRWVEETGIRPNFWRIGCLGYLGLTIGAYLLGAEAAALFYGWLWNL